MYKNLKSWSLSAQRGPSLGSFTKAIVSLLLLGLWKITETSLTSSGYSIRVILSYIIEESSTKQKIYWLNWRSSLWTSPELTNYFFSSSRSIVSSLSCNDNNLILDPSPRYLDYKLKIFPFLYFIVFKLIRISIESKKLARAKRSVEFLIRHGITLKAFSSSKMSYPFKIAFNCKWLWMKLFNCKKLRSFFVNVCKRGPNYYIAFLEWNKILFKKTFTRAEHLC